MSIRYDLHTGDEIANRQYYLFTVTGTKQTVLEVVGFDIVDFSTSLYSQKDGLRNLCALPRDFKTAIKYTIDKLKEETKLDWGIKELYVDPEICSLLKSRLPHPEESIYCSVLAMHTGRKLEDSPVLDLAAEAM
ncbi:hypothetical protein BDZ91DRAFT_764999 [Kalaharituber pfeilii]|nr:hypothetical protein BDZ91DRAFT_764999 [Kalaharituber pfeilii]